MARRRRHLLTATLLLAFAAATNYGVAVWCGMHPRWGGNARRDFFPERQAIPGFVWKEMVRNEPSILYYDEMSALWFADSSTTYSREIWWANASSDPNLVRPLVAQAFAMSGWPFRCLRTEAMTREEAWNSPPPPTIPIPLFFAANTALYGGPLFLAWLGLAQLRRHRRGPNTCPRCGYSLAGLPTTTCPECGKQIDQEGPL